MASPADLVKVVRSEGGRLGVGRELPGRGAWICARSPECVELACPRISRALRGQVRRDALDWLREELSRASGQNPGRAG